MSRQLGLTINCQDGKGTGPGIYFNYCCAIELRIPMADLLKRLDMTLAAVSYAVKRGEKIAKEAGCHLDN